MVFLIDIAVAGSVLLLIVWFLRPLRRAALRLLPASSRSPTLLPVFQAAGARCGTCRRFDAEEGQRILAESQGFPSHFLTPGQMGKQEATGELAGEDGVLYADVETDRTAEVLDGRVHTWKQYGACGVHTELRNEFDVCEHYR